MHQYKRKVYNSAYFLVEFLFFKEYGIKIICPLCLGAGKGERLLFSARSEITEILTPAMAKIRPVHCNHMGTVKSIFGNRKRYMANKINWIPTKKISFGFCFIFFG